MPVLPESSQQAPAAVSIRLLGGFGLRLAGDAQAADGPPTRRAGELLQLLRLQAQHSLLNEQVVEALWPHLDPAAGSANLRKAAGSRWGQSASTTCSLRRLCWACRLSSCSSSPARRVSALGATGAGESPSTCRPNCPSRRIETRPGSIA